MIPRLILTFCLSILAIGAFAQTDSVFYFNADGERINKADTAAFYRVIHLEPDYKFTFTEYRKDGSRVEASAIGTLTTWEYNGYVNWYYKNGKPCEMHLYSNNRPTKTLRYHQNGTLLQTIVYGIQLGLPHQRIIYEADSTGKENILNGNGWRKENGSYTLDLTRHELYTMEGPYRNGARDGIWKGTDDQGITFEERYELGNLVAGRSRSAKGKRYKYAIIYQQAFYKIPEQIEPTIRQNLKNPADTLNLKAVRNHGLTLSYTIAEDGMLQDICGYLKADNSPVKLILTGRPFIVDPAKLRGVPVKSYMQAGYGMWDGIRRFQYRYLPQRPVQTSLKLSQY